MSRFGSPELCAKTTPKISSRAFNYLVLPTFIFMLGFCVNVAPCLAAPTTDSEQVKALEVTASDAIPAGLEKLSGKSVTLKLASGEEVSGVVEEVGPSTLRLGQLTGKEFYSALVAIKDISAVIYRSR